MGKTELNKNILYYGNVRNKGKVKYGTLKKFMLNSVTTALLQVVTMIAGFITPRFMLTAYGSEINGLISSILQFISYFNLVEAGLSSAAVYSLYKPIAEKDYNRINRIVVAAKHFYVKSGFIFVGLVVILAICYPLLQIQLF